MRLAGSVLCRALWLQLALLTLAPALLGCRQPDQPERVAVAGNKQPSPGSAHSERNELEEQRPLVIFLGDSLTAGLGLTESEAFPALLERQLGAAGTPVRVVNAGVSGDTSSGGLSRLDWLLQQEPDVLVIGLGANDGLRGLQPAQTEDNLRQIIRRAQAADAKVLLLGMRVPPNYGPDYVREFERIFPRLSEEMAIPLVPFLLAGVGGRPELNQPDGIHPTAEGQQRLAENVAPFLRELAREP